MTCPAYTQEEGITQGFEYQEEVGILGATLDSFYHNSPLESYNGVDTLKTLRTSYGNTLLGH